MGTLGRVCIKGIILLWLPLFLLGCSPEEVPERRIPSTLSIDKPAPDFIFQPFLGETEKKQKLSQLQGKVIYLDFWASWCKPCLVSMPMLDQLRLEMKNDGFEVIAINLDENPENGKTFLLEHPVSYPVVRVPGDTINELYQVHGLPASYLIDKQGVLRYVHKGFREGDIEKIKKQIKLLL